MFKILGILLLGVVIGQLLKDKKVVKKYINTLITITIFALLFLLGVSIGVDDAILNALPTLGLTALLLTVAGVVGSIICAKLIYNKFYK